MTLVLRVIRLSRWDLSERLDWLAEGDIPADPLADFANTCDNCLSVWLVDDERHQLADILAALAASREKADKLDYVLFPEDHLHIAGIEVRETSGGTPDEGVNQHHRDLTRLSAAKVFALTTRVWGANVELVRADERSVLRLIADSVRRGRVALEKLRPKLRADVRSCLDDERDPRRRPK